VAAAVNAWEAERKDWDAQREKLGQVFGAASSLMYSGTRNYVGGIKLSASLDLDVHWCRPDEYSYRSLRRSAKHFKGSVKEVRAAEKLEHQRLLDLWKEHCPDSIDQDELWDAMGIERGGIRLSGGLCSEHSGTVYLNLGSQSSADDVEGLVEVVSGEYEAARQRVLNQRKAA
jgi:hypothetical protein